MRRTWLGLRVEVRWVKDRPNPTWEQVIRANMCACEIYTVAYQGGGMSGSHGAARWYHSFEGAANWGYFFASFLAANCLSAQGVKLPRKATG